MKERNEVSKTRKRANLLKKKVLSAGNLGPKPDKGNLYINLACLSVCLFVCLFVCIQ